MKRHPRSSLGAIELAELVAQVSHRRPDLLMTCLWLIVTNRVSRRALAEYEPPAGRLIELRRQPGETVARLIEGDHVVEMKSRRFIAARAGLFPLAE